MSNIAWDPAEARAAYALLQAHGFAGLEIAPGLAFAAEEDPFRPSNEALRQFRADLAAFDLNAVSMQSLLFGTSGAMLFGNDAEQAAFRRAVERAISLAAMLEVPNLVFGSPRNRASPEGMAPHAVHEQAMAVFSELGDRAVAAGTVLALEPNPASYGTNFLITLEETAAFVVELGHPGVTMNFDIGALLAEDGADRAGQAFLLAGGKVSHVHISEPELAPAPADPAVCAAIVGQLEDCAYSGWYSIEMRCVGSHALTAIAASMAHIAGIGEQKTGGRDAQ